MSVETPDVPARLPLLGSDWPLVEVPDEPVAPAALVKLWRPALGRRRTSASFWFSAQRLNDPMECGAGTRQSRGVAKATLGLHGGRKRRNITGPGRLRLMKALSVNSRAISPRARMGVNTADESVRGLREAEA
jgi:hypothetical protein